jgi:integrase
MVNSGVNPSVLQKLLNHSDIRVTNDIYTKMETKLLGSQFGNIKFKSGKYVTNYVTKKKIAPKREK